MTTSYTLAGLSSPPQCPNHPRNDMWNTMPFLSPEDRLTLHSLTPLCQESEASSTVKD